ncbi:MAG: flagellar hook-associated protein FlgK [Deltaproteobacteria bacterium]
MSLLSLGSNALSAANNGVAIATNNATNANTEGYSRQTIDFESSLLGGVTSGTTGRDASALLQQRIRASAGSLAHSTQTQASISDLEDTLTSGSGIDVQLSNLFSRIAQASASPTDSTLREAVVQATRDLVGGINGRAAQVASARQDADVRIGQNVPQAAQLAHQLADANRIVAKSGDPAALDHREKIAKQLSSLVGGAARIDPDGNMRFLLDGGAVLVDGTHAATLQTSTDPTTGYQIAQVADGGVTRDVSGQLGGTIGADITFRDTTAKKTADQLDQLAYDTATAFNTQHAANAALDGTTGNKMFVAPASVSGAASQLAIDPTLDANASKLALGSPGGAIGDNSGGLALFALATAKNAVGGTKTLTDAAVAFVGDLGSAGATAKSDNDRDQIVSDHLASLRDSLSGVDTQEELTKLARFQNASSAITKFVSSINDMLTNLIQSL